MVATQAYVALLTLVLNAVLSLAVFKSVFLGVMSIVQGVFAMYFTNCMVEGACTITAWLMAILPLFITVASAILYFGPRRSSSPSTPAAVVVADKPAEPPTTPTPPPPSSNSLIDTSAPVASMVDKGAEAAAQTSQATTSSSTKKETYWQMAALHRATD